MTERQRATLSELQDGKWVIPLDLGAHSRSHHSATLAQLVRRGFVERLQRSGMLDRGGNARGSWKYRITPASLEALRSK